MGNIKSFDDLDIFVTEFMSKWGVTLLRYSLGIIYIWFGALKPMGLSPAQELVENTVYWFVESQRGSNGPAGRASVPW